MDRKASVARGATSLYLANITVLLANTVYFLVLTNVLSSTLAVGIVTALNIMISLLVTVCLLAQPITLQSPIPAPLAVLKFVPELIAKKSQQGAFRVLNASLASTGTLSIAIAAVLLASPGLAIPFLGGTNVLPIYVQLAAIDVIVTSLGQICVGALIALGDMKVATSYLIGWSVVRYGLASVLLISHGITGVLTGWIIGDAILVPLAFWKATKGIGKGGISDFSITQLIRYSLYTLFSALLGFIVNYADRLFTLARQGLGQLAVYNVAIIASSLTGFAPYALLTVLLPALAAMHASNRTQEMRDLVRSYTRYVSIFVTPIAFGFAAVAIIALRVFGPEYTSGLAPTVIVSVATGITAVGAVYASALLAIGELRWYTLANGLGLVALLAVSAATTSILGLNGPAIGRGALLVVAALIYAFAARRRGLLEIDLRALLTAIGASAVMAVVVFGIVVSLHSFLLRLVMLPVLAVVGVALYLGCLRIFHMLTKSDVDFVRSLAPKRLGKLVERVGKLAGAR